MYKIFTLTLLLSSTCLSFGQTVYEFTYDDAGNRTKREVIVMSSQQQDSEEQDVYQVDTLNSKPDEMQFSAYPNPTRESVHVEIDDAFLKQRNKQMTVYDMNGVMLKNKRISSIHESINMSDLPPGSYLLKVSGESDSQEWRILKKD